MTRPPDRFGLRRSTVTSARGVFRTWIYPRLSARAATASARERLRHGTAYGATDQRGDEWVAQMGDPFSSEWRVWVRAPDSVRTEYRWEGNGLPRDVTISGEPGTHRWMTRPAGPSHSVMGWSNDPRIGNPRRSDPVGHPGANGLLYPGWRSVGMTETRRRPAVSTLGREAVEIELVPTLPWSDPRILGADDLPADVENAAPLVVVEDVATGAVVEWRELFQGEVYHRHWWEELELDVSLDPNLFDTDAEPELAPWEGPFPVTVVEPLPVSPPVATVEDASDPAVRQTGLLIGRIWNERDGRVRQQARPGHPVPAAVGPFGREVVLRLDSPWMPAMCVIRLFDDERRSDPVRMAVLGERMGTTEPVAGEFRRDANGTISARLTLPEWTDRLHLRVDVEWFEGALGGGLDPLNRVSAGYAFTLGSSPAMR